MIFESTIIVKGVVHIVRHKETIAVQCTDEITVTLPLKVRRFFFILSLIIDTENMFKCQTKVRAV